MSFAASGLGRYCAEERTYNQPAGVPPNPSSGQSAHPAKHDQAKIGLQSGPGTLIPKNHRVSLDSVVDRFTENPLLIAAVVLFVGSWLYVRSSPL